MPKAYFVKDTFTDVDETALTAHTGEVGATWTQHPLFPSADVHKVTSNRLYLSSAAGSSEEVILASGLPATADYDVEVTIREITDIDEAPGVLGRFSATTATGYGAAYQSSDDTWLLFKNSGGFSSLGNVSQSLTPDQDYVLKLQMRGTAIKLFVDNVERVAATDAAVSAANRAGIDTSTSVATDTTNGFRLDTFLALDAGGLTFAQNSGTRPAPFRPGLAR